MSSNPSQKPEDYPPQRQPPWNSNWPQGSEYGQQQYPYEHFRYHHHGPGLYGLTVEEIRTINECRSDATWKFALPAATIAGVATHGFVRAGYLTANPRWGSFWKVLFAAFCGNFIGRALYLKFGNCQDKLAKLNTPIGETARKLNEAGVRLPPYLIVAGADPHPAWARGPWEYWGNSGWGRQESGFGSGYRWSQGSPSNQWNNTDTKAAPAVTDDKKTF